MLLFLNRLLLIFLPFIYHCFKKDIIIFGYIILLSFNGSLHKSMLTFLYIVLQYPEMEINQIIIFTFILKCYHVLNKIKTF